MNKRSHSFSEDDFRFYSEKGYLLLNPAFPMAFIGEAREDIFRLLQKKKEKTSHIDNRSRETESDLHLKSEAIKKLISSDLFVDICKKLLGGEVDLRFCFTLTKTREHGGPVEWHQDWGLDQDKGYPRISFWVAITDSTLENGCLQILPGSHTGELLPHAVSAKSPPDLGIKDVNILGAIPIEMKAGQVLLIHPQVIHGSGTCLSRNPRIALLGSYQVPKPSYNAFWAKAGAKFLRHGQRDWGPIEVSQSS